MNNPLCNYFGYVFLSYCLLETPVPESTILSPEVVQISARSSSPNFLLDYQWQFINYTWPTYNSYSNALAKRRYIPQNIAIVGMKYYKGLLYLTMPQIRTGVPATLGAISLEDSPKINPLINPYPSWQMNNNPFDCSTLQSVQSMEIDKTGIMWVLDGYRVNNNTKCPPKLLLLDLNNQGRTILQYIFPKEICLTEGGFLNDLVLDENDGGYAYITDNSAVDPGLIVYCRKQNRAWKLRDRSMFAEKDAAGFVVNNMTFNQLSPIDGIALSPPHSKTGNKLLFYSALTGFKLFSIKTNVIKSEKLVRDGDWRRGVKVIGKRQAQTDGMIMDNEGNLYYTLVPLGGVAKWNINSNFASSQVIEQDSNIRWPDGFCFDDEGHLRLIANNIIRFSDMSRELELTGEVHFRIFKYFTGTKSYLH